MCDTKEQIVQTEIAITYRLSDVDIASAKKWKVEVYCFFYR